MSKTPRNGPGDVLRNELGHPLPGQSLRHKTKLVGARALSRYLRREMKKRFNGDSRAYYGWLMDIASSPREKASDRVKAIAVLAERIDGKPVQTVDLEVKGDLNTSNPLATMTVEQLLALAIQKKG